MSIKMDNMSRMISNKYSDISKFYKYHSSRDSNLTKVLVDLISRIHSENDKITAMTISLTANKYLLSKRDSFYYSPKNLIITRNEYDLIINRLITYQSMYDTIIK